MLPDDLLLDDDDELITIGHGCRILGGDEKPISIASYYRGVARGIYEKPVHPSPGVSRLSKKKTIATRRRIIEGGA